MVNNLLASLRQNVDKVNLVHRERLPWGISMYLLSLFHKGQGSFVEY